ncbi:thiopurine S-methyltransferase [Pseudomonas fluorescens]|uniref:Thiopurine S-methyltransferase n=1 Tax=Pseudomonas fluorescens TaxID=294 RepID=A0A944HAR0_PSEFL|nr:thiopurine S-methyltransferase [Pseudomonas fluorescens]MBT2294394.1 thiopurine S-methyltransferase [Pseudomonas fluorescens]MBT2306950.1 thiopurine S-methyltransferase [Pseudomonas fluorescens]MBT2316140.1 thiopurine S-methyltransferase [Pseudomonas fluorescens]MBT2327595.1 thiopurine S-methyltransferase [Pseudomonas fluorescens]MBT2342624.1 thiopurine S-methyltransferase [Pseudomonas fluorescens]
MEPEFWHKRWSTNQIGFHLPEVNPYLQRFWPQLGVGQGTRVLVPLCGKTLDLLWLAHQGYSVLGVELSEKAAADFFLEHQLEPSVSEEGAFKVFRAADIEIRCGDFFALSPEDVSDCTALYDRAALIALPGPMRERYAAHLQTILPQCVGLLITLDYAQDEMPGPPFSVGDDEVQKLLGKDWRLEVLQEQDVLGESWKFLQAGVKRLDERVYRISSR